MKYRIAVHLKDAEAEELRRAVKRHFPDYQHDKWRKMTDDQIKDAVVYCITSTQSRVGSVKKFHKATKGLRIWEKSKQDLEKLLRKYQIRFPKKKARWIAALSQTSVKRVLEEVGGKSARSDLESSRMARGVLKHELRELGIKGLGDKQLSLLSKGIGFSPWLVPLDSRWTNFLKTKALIQEFDDPRYILLEDLVIALAARIGVKPLKLDEAIWTLMQGKPDEVLE